MPSPVGWVGNSHVGDNLLRDEEEHFASHESMGVLAQRVPALPCLICEENAPVDVGYGLVAC
jgi:hypothetical protein